MDALLQVITEDGDAEARRVVEAAQGEANGIRAAADARVEARSAAIFARRDDELRLALEAKRSQALTRARAQVLDARAGFLDRIFAAADAELPGVLQKPASADALVSLCREALDYFPPGEARIRLRAGLAQRLSGVALGGAAIVIDEAVPEGAIVESVDGSARVDNTLAARLRRGRGNLAIKLLAAMAEDA